MSEWHPAKTAPKDGTDILGFGRAIVGHTRYANDIHVVWWDRVALCWSGRDTRAEYELLFWMPLPPPPHNTNTK